MATRADRARRAALRETFKVSGITKRRVQADVQRTTRQPKGLTVSYAGFLVGSQRRVNAFISDRLAAIGSLLDLARGRQDAQAERTDELSDDVVAGFRALREALERLVSATGGALRLGIAQYGQQTIAFNDAKYATPTMRLLGIGDASGDVERAIVRGWVAENTQLIRNVNAEQLGKLETLFLRALRDGSRSAQIQADVSGILGGSVKRARLIARDQIGKLNGQLDRQKQTEAGLEHYIWRGSLDERERPEHVAREAKRFSWRAPPSDGHPGQPVQCRCSAEPDLSDMLGEEFAPEPRSEADFSRATPEARAANRRKVAAKRRRQAKRLAARQALG